jgi:glycosyltransferase domain-containing protein
MTEVSGEPLVTAIVLSINKHDYLRSQLVYYADKPIHLILADGSDTEWCTGSSGSIGKMTWEHFQMAGFNTYFSRMLEACQRVKTEFMFFLDDEDCTLWTGTTRAIRYLSSNPDHFSAGGSVVLSTNTRRRLGIITNQRFSPFSVSHEQPLGRVMDLLANRKTPHLYYQVHRTINMAQFAQSMLGLPPEIALRYGEWCFAIYAATLGKWRSDLYPFSVRRRFFVANPISGIVQKPKFTKALAADLSERIADALFAQQTNARKFNIIRPEEISDLLLHFINSHKETSTVSDTRFRRLIGMKLLPKIFDVLPAAYQMIRPRGIRTVEAYSRFGNDESSIAVIRKDLSDLEKLWMNYPTGINETEFERFIANIE